MVLSLYELAQIALDEAYRLRCEYLLENVYENIPTPIEQNGKLQIVKKRKLCDSENYNYTDTKHVSVTTDIKVEES